MINVCTGCVLHCRRRNKDHRRTGGCPSANNSIIDFSTVPQHTRSVFHQFWMWGNKKISKIKSSSTSSLIQNQFFFSRKSRSDQYEWLKSIFEVLAALRFLQWNLLLNCSAYHPTGIDYVRKRMLSYHIGQSETIDLWFLYFLFSCYWQHPPAVGVSSIVSLRYLRL